jgi:hypothetical protein
MMTRARAIEKGKEDGSDGDVNGGDVGGAATMAKGDEDSVQVHYYTTIN